MPTIKVPPVLRPDGRRGRGQRRRRNRGRRAQALAERIPSTKDQLFSPEGDLNRYVNVYLNDEDVRVLDGLDTSGADSDTVVILPAMAGGSAELAGVSRASRRSGRRTRSRRASGRATA